MKGAAARRRLEAEVSEALGKAYLFGTVLMATEGSAPLGYPDIAAVTEHLLNEADAYATAARGRSS